MDKIVSCCGCVCSECQYFPDACKGCPEIQGKAFWLAYTGEPVCKIYDCCVNTKRQPHCGLCGELPCRRYEGEDPTKSPEENAEDHRKQLEQLRRMMEAENS
ncbi:DUF3795 domain-containing protein [Anaeromassilibacillus senegalensis]|uniref:DUF3795 domain-containing protein n=1 Tax=Anaeromassilibacillus senegalensis TaxID=1673717 RepID=UPI00067F98EF|nr:DUF3795 domain-containing protein [Anaeromassilibacillus senegalensis]